MVKKKLRRFREMSEFNNVIEPHYDEILFKDYKLKGDWNKTHFKNDKPIVLELGCGKGEYTVNLAKQFPEKNYIGIDIKGARMWRGAKTAIEEDLRNVVFVRTKVEFIESFFAENEVDEIWITFPDPHLKDRKSKKRLTSSRFLNSYRRITKPDSIIHLKTDSLKLYEYTLNVIKKNKLETFIANDNLYDTETDDVLSIKTFYEEGFLEEGRKITYLKFRLSGKYPFEEPDDDE